MNNIHCLSTSEMVLIMPKVAFQITHIIILVFFQAYREKHMFRLSKGQFIATASNQAQKNSSQRQRENI